MYLKYCCLILVILIKTSTGYYTKDNRIVGGNDASFRVKYQASLRSIDDGYICGGSILNSRWIATAAHCITEGMTKAFVGSNKLNDTNTFYNIIERITHEKYNASEFDNDIGLIKTDIDIEYNRNVGPISLPTEDISLDNILTVTGWGLTSHPNGITPNNLQILRTFPIDQSECARRLSKRWPKSVLCTFNSLNKGHCYGDSGSPLVNDGVLYGIVAGVVPCALGYPDVNVRVFELVSWIEATIKE